MLLVVQINVMLLVDIRWWICSLNFLFVWVAYLLNISNIKGSKSPY